MRIRAKRDAATGFGRHLDKVGTKVLTIGITAAFDGFVQFGGFRKDAWPVRSESQSEVINASARMTENLRRDRSGSGGKNGGIRKINEGTFTFPRLAGLSRAGAKRQHVLATSGHRPFLKYKQHRWLCIKLQRACRHTS